MKELFYIISLLLGICFFVILTYNNIKKNNIIKYLFILFSLGYLIIIILLDSNFIYEFLKAIITYLWYPNYLIFVILIITSIIVQVLNNIKKENNLLKRIFSNLLFSICFSCYIIFLNLDIDPTLYSSLYQTNSLTLMRIVSISFIIYFIFILILKMRGKNEG